MPSLNSSTTGPVSWSRIRWRQRSRTARDHMPAFCAQVDSAAADGDVSPGVPRNSFGIEFHAVVATGDDHGQQARMDRRLLGDAQMDRRPGIRPATRISHGLRTAAPAGPEMWPSFKSTSSPPQRHVRNRPVCLVRTEPLPACPVQAASGRSSDPRRREGQWAVCLLQSTNYQQILSRHDRGSSRITFGRRLIAHSVSGNKANGGAWTTRWAPSYRGRAWSASPLASGRLSGLSFAVKDLFDIAGSVTTYGNPDWAEHPPRRDHDRPGGDRSAAGGRPAGRQDQDRWSSPTA